MKFKILHIVTILLLMYNAVFAQQEESYTQYVFNQYAQNPAYGGTKECSDIKFGSRLQWVGFAGAPVTSFFSYNTAVGYVDVRSKVWHGLGVYLVDDRNGTSNGSRGFYKSTALYPSYALHLRMNHRMVASAGFFVGIRNFSSGIGSQTTDPLLAKTSRIIFPDFGAGLLLYNPEWFIGISMKQLYTNTISTTTAKGVADDPFQFRARQYYFTAARWIEAPALLFSYTPSINIKYHESIMPSVDLSIMFHYLENKFNIGGNYRIGDGAALMLQFNLLRKLSLGYAYEYPFNKINKGSRQTHEIILRWDPCWTSTDHFGGVNCPSF